MEVTQQRKVNETTHNLRIQVPVDVAVKEPWASIVGKESNGHDVRMASPDAHDIADDRVVEVIGFASSAPNHMEGMLVRDVLVCKLVTGTHV